MLGHESGRLASLKTPCVRILWSDPVSLAELIVITIVLSPLPTGTFDFSRATCPSVTKNLPGLGGITCCLWNHGPFCSHCIRKSIQNFDIGEAAFCSGLWTQIGYMYRLVWTTLTEMCCRQSRQNYMPASDARTLRSDKHSNGCLECLMINSVRTPAFTTDKTWRYPVDLYALNNGLKSLSTLSYCI